MKNIGYESYLSIKEIHQKGVEASKSPEVKEKIRKTRQKNREKIEKSKPRKNHRPLDIHTCEICKSKFNSRSSLMNHLRLTHEYTGKQYYDKFFKKSENECKCKICVKPTKFLNTDDGYAETCSHRCAMKLCAENNIKKYGYSSILCRPDVQAASHSEETNRKRKETMRRKYGVDYYTETDEFKEASKKYKEEHKDEIKEKSKATCLKKYGVEYSFQAKEVREKIVQTNLKKYGSANVWSSEYGKQKAKETMIKKYGVDHIFKLQSVQEKAQKNSHTPEAIEKMHANRDYREIARKTTETRKKNGNRSKLEIEFAKLCEKRSIEYIEEYSDSRYPFPCDFYLPDLDYFIEIHGSWVHGGHLYDKNNQDDKNTLQKWKSKNSKYYDSAIRTWTIKDIEKAKAAKENNLNYVILWSLEDIHLWFTSSIKIISND